MESGVRTSAAEAPPDAPTRNAVRRNSERLIAESRNDLSKRYAEGLPRAPWGPSCIQEPVPTRLVVRSRGQCRIRNPGRLSRGRCYSRPGLYRHESERDPPNGPL